MKITILFFLAILLPAVLKAGHPIDSAALLRQAEMKRMPWNQMSLTAQLSESRAGAPVTVYRVLLSGENALVIFVKPETSKGNLLLMQRNDLWIYFKGTKQASMVTAMQRLTGAVSYVDLARLNWSKDYRISSVESGKKTINESDITILHLSALAKENAYQKIDLWVNPSDKRPVTADIYLGSGRMFKTIQFSRFENIGGKDVNTQIVITDHLADNRQSIIDFTGIKNEKKFPASYFVKDSLPVVSKEMME